MPDYVACRAETVVKGRCQIVHLAGHEVGLFRVEERFVAVLNRCPHQAAPVCRGEVGGMALCSEPGKYQWSSTPCVLRCPWHGWEFDLSKEGRAVFDSRLRLKTYPVREQDGKLIVTL